MRAVPGASAVTIPDADTDAIEGFVDSHVIARFGSVFPALSLTVALSCAAAPSRSVTDSGLTKTRATGTGFTVRVAVPRMPSLFAAITVVLSDTDRTNPLESTVATAGETLDHVTTRPSSTLPARSRSWAFACVVPPSTTLADVKLTATLATGTGVTVSMALPERPSLVAVIVAEPGATALAVPLPLIAATAGFDVVHVTGRAVSSAPVSSRSFAVTCVVPPATRLAAPRFAVTLATGTGSTVSVALPARPSLVAVIVAVPGVTARTVPKPSTLRTAGSELDHLTTRPVRIVPAASRSFAVACVTPPVTRLGAATLTVTVAAGTGAGGWRGPAAESAPSAATSRATSTTRPRRMLDIIR
jgi:hypothetical protein